MQLKLMRHLWGIEMPWEQAFPRIKAEGFEGVDAWFGMIPDLDRLRSLLGEHGLTCIAAGGTGGKTVDEHLRSFEALLKKAKSVGALQVTVHSGSDAWRRSDVDAFYKEVTAIERDTDLIVGHETHRGRTFFNPWTTRDVLEKFEAIRLVCDFSHWVCVAERLNWDDAEGSILKLAAERCVYIHARVGYCEGPQVPDPSAKEYQTEVETHEKWWKVIWEAQKRRGMKVSPVVPEFGPPPYLHTLPHTNVPVADLWAVCKYMADRVSRAFKQITE